MNNPVTLIHIIMSCLERKQKGLAFSMFGGVNSLRLVLIHLISTNLLYLTKLWATSFERNSQCYSTLLALSHPNTVCIHVYKHLYSNFLYPLMKDCDPIRLPRLNKYIILYNNIYSLLIVIIIIIYKIIL